MHNGITNVSSLMVTVYIDNKNKNNAMLYTNELKT